MTRKDYVSIAAVLNGTKPPRTSPVWEATVQAMADMLARDNPLFNRSIFIAHCKGE